MDRIESAKELMLMFAQRTSIEESGAAPVRYLWTDAFAVCNYWGLYRLDGDRRYRELAEKLIGEVHRVLGRYREDDTRNGWLSGLDEEEGRQHPTAGGLRIGKKLPERETDAPYDEQKEWDQDGQYFHYLTKWMLALYRSYQETKKESYLIWAVELASVAYEKFSYLTPEGVRRLYWKMRTDLSAPLVTSMGQHDALDGYIVYGLLEEGIKSAGLGDRYSLNTEREGLWQMLSSMQMATTDALGIGGLFSGTALALELREKTGEEDRLAALSTEMLYYGLIGTQQLLGTESLHYPAQYRLAFRELGLAIGLEGIRYYHNTIRKLLTDPKIEEAINKYLPLAEALEEFWLEPSNQETETWQAHRDINEVMLATALVPDGFYGKVITQVTKSR